MKKPSRSSPADTRSAKRTAPPIRPSTSGSRRPARRSKNRISAGTTRSAAATATPRSRAASKAPGRTTPTKWNNVFFDNLFNFEWELTKSPAGAKQWTPKDGAGNGSVPDAHDPNKKHAPIDAHHRPRAEDRSGLRADLQALPREPASVCRRLCQSVVQTHAPRHGSDRALSRPRSAGRNGSGKTRCRRSIIR